MTGTEHGREQRCPGCNGRPLFVGGEDRKVVRCASCGGLFTVLPISAVHARTIVKDKWCRCSPFMLVKITARQTYYDFDLTDGTRIHGWFDPQCGGITQTG